MSVVYESGIIDSPVGKVWANLRPLTFKFVDVIIKQEVLTVGEGKSNDGPTVGTVMSFLYQDGSQEVVRITDISDVDFAISYELVSSKPPVEKNMTQKHTIRLRPVTHPKPQTMIEFSTECSEEMSLSKYVDSKMKKRNFFASLRKVDSNGEWSCCQCTFLNSPKVSVCELCGGGRLFEHIIKVPHREMEQKRQEKWYSEPFTYAGGKWRVQVQIGPKGIGCFLEYTTGNMHVIRTRYIFTVMRVDPGAKSLLIASDFKQEDTFDFMPGNDRGYFDVLPPHAVGGMVDSSGILPIQVTMRRHN